MISREAIKAPALPEQAVLCEPLGGEVLVRGMDLAQSTRFYIARRKLVKLEEGETEDDAARRAGVTLIPMVLAMCVLAEDRQPVYTEAEWTVWCAAHMPAAMAMFTVATELSGTDPNAEKKS